MKKLEVDNTENNQFSFIDLLNENKKLEIYGNKFELTKKDGEYYYLTVNGGAAKGDVFNNNDSHINLRDDSCKVFIDGREFKGKNFMFLDKDGSISFLCVDDNKNIEGTFFGFNKEILEEIKVNDDIFYKIKDDKIIEANHYPKYLLKFDLAKLFELNEKLKQNNQVVSDNLSEQFSRYKQICNAFADYNVPDDNPAFCTQVECWKIGKDKMLFANPGSVRCYDSGQGDEIEEVNLRFVLWDERWKEVVQICEFDRHVADPEHIMVDERYIYLRNYENNKLKTDIYSLDTFNKVKTIEKNVNDERKKLHINRETLDYYDENKMNNMMKTFVLEQLKKKKVQAANKIQRVFRKYKKDKAQKNNTNININLEKQADQKNNINKKG